MSQDRVTGVPVLTVRGVTKAYPGVQALDGVDLEVRAGEVHCLLGQNGAGKSTLIKVVSGLVAPDKGTVELLGEPLALGNPVDALRRGIATIYQELDLVPSMRAYENVTLGNESTQSRLLRRDRDVRRTRELFAQLGHPEISPDAVVGELSPARQQVVSMARALSHDVKVLVLDEPSAILDGEEVDTLLDIVRRLAEQGVAIVYITHRLDEVVRIGSRVTVLKNGRTVHEGPADTPPAELVEKMVGKAVADVFPPAPAEKAGDVLLEVQGLSRTREFEGVSLSVRAGEVVGLAGLVGAGRTEVVRCLYGLTRPAAGTVTVAGRPVRPGDVRSGLKAGLALAPEERKSQGLVLDWELDKNVSLPSLHRFRRARLLRPRAERAAAVAQLRRLGTRPDNPAAHARTLSGGNQQKVVLARWLLHGCRVMLLDEPTRGIDVEARSEIYRQIRGFTGEGGGALVVSSDFAELVGLCDRIVVIREGRVVGEVAGDEATETAVLALAIGADQAAVEAEIGDATLTAVAAQASADKSPAARRTASRAGEKKPAPKEKRP
ncbi:MAG TPA: sugar ABC transporter ATP-binding protein [Mycobacteriales bacterium]|nr:sugar ABC transporter ATP-binding protein [Mycobacteriales bacterium]